MRMIFMGRRFAAVAGVSPRSRPAAAMRVTLKV